MQKVQVWAELTDEHYRAYQAEARRQGVDVTELVQRTVNCLLRELEREEEDCGPEGTLSVS